MNYPGEEPILDCDSVIPTIGRGVLNIPLYTTGMNYVSFKGLTVRNVWQNDGDDQVVAWWINGNNVTVENCKVYNTHGLAFKANECDDTYFINCDAWNNCDSLTTVPASNPAPGNDGTGFQDFNWTDSSKKVYFIGCRAWNCGDQGFSAGSIGYTEFDGCWSFNNGQLEGGGHGFKMGWVNTVTPGVLNRVYKNCIAANNRSRGWDSNDQGYGSGSFNVLNNISYKNNEGFRIFNTTDSDVNEQKREYYNNVAYKNNSSNLALSSGALYTGSNNSWNGGVSVTDEDFVSLDNTQMARSRKSDGSLPEITFLTLASTSDLIDAGKDVGLSFYDKYPDLGYAEYGSVTIDNTIEILSYSPESTVDFVYIDFNAPQAGAVDIDIQNSTGENVLSMTYQAIEGDDNRVGVDLSALSSGTYTITLQDDSSSDACTVSKEDALEGLVVENVKSFPNPTSDLFVVEFTSKQTTSVTIQVMDELDVEMYIQQINTSVGENKVVLDFSSYNPGVYKVILNAGGSEVQLLVTKI